MKILLIILSLQIAFPSMGYSLIQKLGCHAEKASSRTCCSAPDDLYEHDGEEDNSCGDDCSCACCFMLQIFVKEKTADFRFALELFSEKSIFFSGLLIRDLTSGIWQPPKMG